MGPCLSGGVSKRIEIQVIYINVYFRLASLELKLVTPNSGYSFCFRVCDYLLVTVTIEVFTEQMYLKQEGFRESMRISFLSIKSTVIPWYSNPLKFV